MRSANNNKPAHITRGDVFGDLGLSPEKAMALRLKSSVLLAIVDEVKRKRYRQSQLVQILDEHQPVVSNLLRGKISHMSLEKLLIYANRLGLSFELYIPRGQARRRRAA